MTTATTSPLDDRVSHDFPLRPFARTLRSRRGHSGSNLRSGVGHHILKGRLLPISDLNLNLDGFASPEELEEVAKVLSTLADYAKHKAAAMSYRARRYSPCLVRRKVGMAQLPVPAIVGKIV